MVLPWDRRVEEASRRNGGDGRGCGSGAEGVAVFGGGAAMVAAELVVEIAAVVEAAASGDVFDGEVGFDEEAGSVGEAGVQAELGKRDSHGLAEEHAEPGHAQAADGGGLGEREAIQGVRAQFGHGRHKASEGARVGVRLPRLSIRGGPLALEHAEELQQVQPDHVLPVRPFALRFFGHLPREVKRLGRAPPRCAPAAGDREGRRRGPAREGPRSFPPPGIRARRSA